MQFKNGSIYKHKHSKTYDAEFGGMCLLNIFAAKQLPLLYNLILKSFISFGSLALKS
jgi:hypothetical protein